MAYQAEFEVSPHVAKRILNPPKITNRDDGFTDVKHSSTTKQFDTLEEIQKGYEVSITYNEEEEHFVISGDKDNSKTVIYKIKGLIKKIFKERRAHQKFAQSKNEIYHNIVKQEDKKQNTRKKEKTATNKSSFIDTNNIFNLLPVEDDENDSLDVMSQQIQYNNDKSKRKKRIIKLEKRFKYLDNKLLQINKDKKYYITKQNESKDSENTESSEELQVDTSKYDNEIKSLKMELIKIETILQELDHDDLLTFEEYTKLLSEGYDLSPTREITVNYNTDMFDELEEDTSPKGEISINDDEPSIDIQPQRRNNSIVSDEQLETEMNNFLGKSKNMPHNRNYYQRKIYKGKHNNTKSETWTYSKERHVKDNKRHFNTGHRHHSRQPNTFTDNDMNDELRNLQHPTDTIKDKLNELIGTEQSDFPPLITQEEENNK